MDDLPPASTKLEEQPMLRRTLSAWLVISLFAVVAAALIYRLYLTEGYVSNFVFATLLTAAILSALIFATRKPLASLIALTSFIAVVSATSYVKYEATTVALHIWDFVYYAASWDTVIGWWRGHPGAIAVLIAGLAGMTIGTWLIGRVEAQSVARKWALTGCAACVLLATAGERWRGERPHMLYNFPDWHWSSFLISFNETAEAALRGSLIEAASKSNAPPFASNEACTPLMKPPHVILIHQESVGPPSLFPELKFDPAILPLFNSFDGKMHKMRVETFGGGSWLTESSVLLGLSSQFFGGMKHFIQYFTAGRLRDTLPMAMENCGYRTVMFYPAFKGFFGNAKFFETIGIGEIFDRKAQGAKSDWESDRFYFNNALDEIGRHIAVSQKPLFTYIQTMSAHWPYDIAFQPGAEVPGGGPGTHPEINEYLRRLSLAKIDYDDLKQQLRERFPQEHFLIVQYGDHHALPIAYLFGYREDADVKDMQFAPDSPAMTTYYAVDGVNYASPALPAIDVVDVGYLGAILLDAARLPMPASWRERLRLMQACNGKYFDCPQRDAVLAFHRRLIESGLLPRL